MSEEGLILILDDLLNMPYELILLQREFPGRIETSNSYGYLAHVEQAISNGAVYGVTIINPLALNYDNSQKHPIDAWEEILTNVKEVTKSKLIIGDSGLSGLIGFRDFRILDGYQNIHAKPYDAEKLVSEVKLLMSR